MCCEFKFLLVHEIKKIKPDRCLSWDILKYLDIQDFPSADQILLSCSLFIHTQCTDYLTF